MRPDLKITTASAAALLGLQPRRVRQLAKAGAFPGHEQVGTGNRAVWWVPVEAVLEYQRTAGRGNRARQPAPSVEELRELLRALEPGGEGLSEAQVDELLRGAM
jgi:phage terminase Nu1 subunit (DNA packaging protein)